MKRILKYLFFFLAWSSSLSGLSQNLFTDVTEQSGIDHFFVPHQGTFGGGVAVIDFNEDGYEDLFMAGGAGSCSFYKNNGDGTFTNIIKSAGFFELDTVVTQGVVSADVNKDGKTDIYITALKTKSTKKQIRATDLLYINNGDGTFSNQTHDFGLDKIAAFSTGATFGDINLDGYPDLFVGVFLDNFEGRLDRYGGQASRKSPPAWDYLYINKKGKYFKESSKKWGLHYIGLGFGGIFTDFDNDRDLDLLVANDFGYKFTPNLLFRNEYPKKKFTEVGKDMAMDFGMSAMGIAVGDYDNDGWLDYVFSNIGVSPFAVNQGPEKPFVDKSRQLGTAFEFQRLPDLRPANNITWGTNFFDSDNDMDLDLFFSCGGINPHPEGKPIPNILFENKGTKFEECDAKTGLKDFSVGRGSVTFDYDNDGDLDLFVVNQTAVKTDYTGYDNLSSRLYRNDAPANNWLKVKLIGLHSDHNGIGSRVEVYANNTIMIREIDGGSSHESQNSTIAHFGMKDQLTADSVIVKWLGGGGIQKLHNVPANQMIVVREEVNESKWQEILSPLKLVLFAFCILLIAWTIYSKSKGKMKK
ncbi:MAG: CRTAC1 family protein [Bacteroidetes bacterium]|nr:CRTAC1 family protein [Bacteroidota bacterium]